jgi:periplasmic protein TonB
MTSAMLITAGLALFIFLCSVLATALKPKEQIDFVVKDMSLSEVKKEEKKPEPPPPPPKLPPPPKIETIKFTPPKIVKDNEVKPDEKPPEIEKIEDTKIDVKSQEGEKDNGIVAPAVSDKGSNVVETVKENEDEKIFTKVEQDAEFPGGQSAWTRYLQKNLNANVPVDNSAPAGSYTVVVRFVVSRNGEISDIQCESDPGYGMCDEAKRIIRRGPQWKPALQNGRNVNAYRRQPITFVVEEQ